MVQGEVSRIPSYPVEVVDTTGAGDTFDAAFLYALHGLGYDERRAAAFGATAAARSCQFVGGVAARSTCDDVLTFAKDHGAVAE